MKGIIGAILVVASIVLAIVFNLFIGIYLIFTGHPLIGIPLLLFEIFIAGASLVWWNGH